MALLNGLATCALCGNRLHPTYHSGGKWRVYRCKNGAWRGPRACPGASVGVEELDAAVLGLVAGVANEPEMRALIEREEAGLAGAQDAAMEEERAQLEGRRLALERERDGLVSALSRGAIGDADFARAAGRLSREEAPIRTRLEEIEAALSGRLGRERAAAHGGLHLSDALLAVLAPLGSGATTRDVVAITGLSWATVTGRRQDILEATDSSTLYEALQKARKAGYLV